MSTIQNIVIKPLPRSESSLFRALNETESSAIAVLKFLEHFCFKKVIIHIPLKFSVQSGF